MRKTLVRYFVRAREEFASDEAYNDYLEEFENLVFCLLEMKNDNAVKERIAEIKESDSILSPRPVLKKPGSKDTSEESAKRSKPAGPAWGIFHGSMPARPTILKSLEIPEDMIVPCEAGGLTRRLVLSFIVGSLYEH